MRCQLVSDGLSEDVSSKKIIKPLLDNHNVAVSNS